MSKAPGIVWATSQGSGQLPVWICHAIKATAWGSYMKTVAKVGSRSRDLHLQLLSTQVPHRPYPPFLHIADHLRTHRAHGHRPPDSHPRNRVGNSGRGVPTVRVQHINQSPDPALFQNLLRAYEQLVPPEGVSLPNAMDLAQLDVAWVGVTMQRNQADLVELEVELETYSNKMIIECIRVSGVWCCWGSGADGWVCRVDGASRYEGFLSVGGAIWARR